MAEHWNTAITARVVITACEAQGVRTAPILEAAGIDPAVLEDPDGRVSLEQMRSFWQQAVEQSGDPSIGLHAGEHAPPGIYRTFEYLFAYSSTVGAGLERFAQYMPLINSWLLLDTASDADFGRLTQRTVFGFLPRTTAEYVFSTLLTWTRHQWKVEWAPRKVCFEFARPAEAPDEHARVLGCDVEFDAPRTEMIIDRTTWDRPVRTADEALIAVLEEHARLLLERLPKSSPLVQSVGDAVGKLLSTGDASLDAVARDLGTTGRTLQRRLAADGLVFSDLADMVRLESARLRLAEGSLSLAEVAYMVGFAEQSSFSRAFKRWTGMSPREYRRARRGASGGSGTADHMRE